MISPKFVVIMKQSASSANRYMCASEAHIYLFADDAELCRHIAHKSDYELLQTALSKLQDWSDTWLLKLNIQKCKAVSYGRNVNKDYKYHMLQEGTKMIVRPY